jgi:hypothetical protein
VAPPGDLSPSGERSILQVNAVLRDAGGLRGMPLHPAGSEAISPAAFQDPSLRGGGAAQRDARRRGAAGERGEGLVEETGSPLFTP